MKILKWLNARKAAIRAARGMTLLEIMVVIAIIGIVTSAIAVGVSGYMSRAKVQTCKAKIRNISQAIEVYMMDSDCPASLSVLADSSNALLKEKQLKDEWQQDFIFNCPSQKEGRNYDLCSKGPDKREGTPDDICNE